MYSFCSLSTYAQDDSLRMVVDSLLPGDSSRIQAADTTYLIKNRTEEMLIENSGDESETSVLIDQLEKLKANPLDLNTISYNDIQVIPFINAVIAKNIVDFRKGNRRYVRKTDLLLVPGVDTELYDKIKPYIKVESATQDVVIDETGTKIDYTQKKSYKGGLNFKYTNRFSQDLQPRSGFINGNYPGSRPRIYNQLNIKYKQPEFILEANATIEKDAGETSLTDFSSAYVELKKYKFINELVAGDYTLQFGQGLAMWSSLSFSKGIDAVNPIKKKGKGIDSYSSVNEVQFFRGGAADIRFNNFSLSTFYSDNYFDASVDTTLGEVSSPYYDGYHRTPSEIARKHSAKEQLLGGHLAYSKEGINIGTTYWRSTYDKSFKPDATQLYNFTGDNANMISVDYDAVYKNMNIFGEIARSQTGALASINSIQFTFYKIADLVFSYRYYSPDFIPLHSFAFGERSGVTQNEKGFYTGIKIKPFKGLTINSYFDQYKYPYRTFSEPVPISGNDNLVFVEWKANSKLLVNIKYKNENKEETRSTVDDLGRTIKLVDSRQQLNLRAEFIYDISNRATVKTRYEYVNVDYRDLGGDNKGFLIYSDIKAVPIKGLAFSVRLTLFQTDAYDSRIYVYENDVPGFLSNIALYGKGKRWYMMLSGKPLPYLNIYAKYSETYFDDVKTISSGNDLINNNINNRLNLGLVLNF